MTDAATPTGKVGNLTRDPELRFGRTGTAFATFGLAVTPYVKDGPDQATVFYEVVAFGSLAEHLSECLAKGDRVVVVGRGELERWTGKDGTERTTRKIVAEGVGHDLRFVSVQLQRLQREQPAAVGAGTGEGYGFDEEPF